MRRRAVLGGIMAGPIAGCAGRGPPAPADTVTFRAAAPLSCVPFARELSGIDLAGDAHAWWHAAAGRYARSDRPAPGAVLVLRSTRRLPQGHLAVVLRQTGPREILVSHANWASGAARGAVHHNQPVVDVSRRNDWSEVRLWYPPAQALGTSVFAAHGFIHPPGRRTAEEIAADVPRAARAAALPFAAR